MNENEFLTIYEFCEVMKIHYNTARKMIKVGRLSAFKMGTGGKTSDIRIPSSELHRLAIVNLGDVVDKIVENRIKEKENKNLNKFFEKVKKTETCWLWTGATSESGYGAFGYRGKWMRANRVSFLIHKGEIPEEMLVCHSCDNPQCVNPDHLFLGTPTDNMNDMIKKGRSKFQPKGEKNTACKLTDKQVLEIKEMRKNKIAAKEIAKKFNISADYVYEISYGKHRK